MAQRDTHIATFGAAGEPEVGAAALHQQPGRRDGDPAEQPVSGGGRVSGRGPKGYRRSDERIREDICERLLYDPHVDSSEVTVEVRAGHVVLEGSVTERRMKHAIEDVAASCAGVTDIDNRIKVLRPAWREAPPFLY